MATVTPQDKVNKLQSFLKDIKEKFPDADDETIINFVRKKDPSFNNLMKDFEDKGIPNDKVYGFLGNKFGVNLKPKEKKGNLFSKAFRNLVDPIGVELENRGKENNNKDLEEVGRELTPSIASGALGIPRGIIDFPTNLIRSQVQFRFPDIEQPESSVDNPFGSFNPSQAYVPTSANIPELQQDPLFTEDIPEIGDVFGPLFRGSIPGTTEIRDALFPGTGNPETEAGQRAQRIGEFAGGGALGGPVGSLIGAGLGAIDFNLEQQGVSPAHRALVSTGVGTLGGTASSLISKPKLKTSAKDIKSSTINTANDLANKILFRNPEDINFEVLKDLVDSGIDPTEVPIQTYTKGGIPNLIEGVSENSQFGQNRFNKIMNEFSKSMTEQADKILDSFPIEEINTAVTAENLGEPQFQNPLTKTLNDVAPQLDLTRQEIGQIGLEYIKSIDESLKESVNQAYGDVKLTKKDVINPESQAYEGIKRSIKAAREKIGGKGFIGGERKEALSVLRQVNQLFKPENTPPSKLLNTSGEPIVKGGKNVKPIALTDIIKNIQALNKALNYENPAVINLLMPVANAMRDALKLEALNNSKLAPFLRANEIFAQRANLFKNPTIENLSKLSGEKFFNAIKNPSVLDEFKNFAQETGSIKAYDNVRGALLSDILRGPLEADTPKQLASKLTDGVIDKVRQIEKFYPEYQDLTQGLRKAKEEALQFSSPEALRKSQIIQDVLQYQIGDDIPSVVLKEMNTTKGIDLVRDTLSATENGKKIFNSIARKKVEQILYDGSKKTEINLKDLSGVLKDEKNVALLKKLLPDENFKQLEKLTRIAEGLQEGKMTGQSLKKNLEKYVTGGAILGFFGSAFGLPLASPTAGVVGIYALSKALTSKNFRQSLIKRSGAINPNKK